MTTPEERFAARRTVAVYRRRPAGPLDAANTQQQAAAAWDTADELNIDVQAVNGAELGRDPHEPLD